MPCLELRTTDHGPRYFLDDREVQNGDGLQMFMGGRWTSLRIGAGVPPRAYFTIRVVDAVGRTANSDLIANLRLDADLRWPPDPAAVDVLTGDARPTTVDALSGILRRKPGDGGPPDRDGEAAATRITTSREHFPGRRRAGGQQ